MGVIHLTKDNFEEEAVNSEIPVFIDFYADWCGPCRMVSPIVEEISEERSDVKICKVNVDDCPELAAAFGVQSIPMMAVLKAGKVVAEAVGASPKSEINAIIDKALE